MTTRNEDYSKWYLDIVLESQLVEYGPVRGTMILKPYGYAIWDNIKNILDKMIKDTGHQNVSFPTLIPKSFFEKESEHVEGFAPELFEVKNAWGSDLEDSLVLRPTSETIIWHTFKNWIKSHRDLPILINQWANVFRMEKKTKPFLRTSEFLWQEGHTAHKTEQEAQQETIKMLDVYKQLFEEYFSIPVLAGKKSENEKFAGAVSTYSIEVMVQDGKAVQSGTSHYFGQNFAKAFDVVYQDENNKESYPYSSSWGTSTRIIGALIMSHSDDKGLILPPKLAPISVVIVPIFNKNNKDIILEKSMSIYSMLSGKISVKIDTDSQNSPGWKFSEYELKGIPVRIEVGQRDLEKNFITFVRRDTLEKEQVSLDILNNPNGLLEKCNSILNNIQQNLYNIAKKRLDSNIFDYSDKSYDDFKNFFQNNTGGFLIAGFHQDSESKQVEKKIKEDTKATIRIIKSENQDDLKNIKCIYSRKPANMLVYFAKSY